MKEDAPAFRLKYNGIVVIQSLPDDEKQTGTILYDDIIARRCDQNGHGKYFYNPSSKNELIEVLNIICDNVLNDDLLPILHFEIHGSEHGLGLKNGDFVVWKELQEYCRLINVKTKNQLIVTLATCWGSSIWKMIDIGIPAPYWGYIGPREKIGAGDIMEDFGEFYDSLLTEQSWDKALERLVENGNRKKYIYLHCKGIFEYYIEKNYKGTTINKQETFKRLVGQTKNHYPQLNRADRRKRLKDNLRQFSRESFIAKMKKAFLMT
ncbi:hypothetical protein [Pedobacter sp. ASV28]|uniref:hypothetical protein n=1 Tax=Pedobacter sp. ASV28 TaxID=2795123 RepID=UPI0018EABDF8|nr:hypothetical protein [Pedobacter sp. ASV28]